MITAHDVETLPDGRTIVHTYDNERPFLPAEDSDTSGATHRDREEASEVVINAAKNHWEYSGWSGGNDGSLYATKLTDFPADPTLPGVAEAIIGIFGSKGGAAVTGREGRRRRSGPRPRPQRDARRGRLRDRRRRRENAQPRHERKTERHLLADDHGRRLPRRGARREDGERRDVDQLTGTPKQNLIRFAGERTRRLDAQRRGRSRPREPGRHDPDRDLRRRQRHRAAQGGPLPRLRARRARRPTFSFSLSATEPGASAAHFESGPLRVRRGERIVATPGSWRAPSAVQLSIRRANGHRETRRLRNRAAGPSARISVTRLHVGTARGRKLAQVTARLRRLRGRTVQGVVLRLTRGGKTVARRGFGVRRPRNGSRTFRWRLPAGLARGGYVLVADVTVASLGAQSGTRRATRRASLRL